MTEPLARRRVLIVEDEESIALALEYLLGRAGHHPERIAHGATALACIRATRPDLVLLDVMLPGVSGYEICRDLRHDPLICTTPVLLMSARGAGAERRKGLECGADGFLPKPFEIAQLHSEIARLLALRR